ncbi:MAG: Do family serine endopeptidase [Bryobacteraceae bacterium]|nr:Do family serine endopeptidase [Bryobacteraceae bacterium]
MTFRAAIFLLSAVSPVLAARLPAGDLADLVEKTLPSVVRILTTRPGSPAVNPSVNAAYDGARGSAKPRTKSIGGEGSGVVVSADGYLLTNHHVVDQAEKITIELAGDRVLPARLVAADPATDLAVLKIEAANLTPIAFGDSARLRVGESVFAIGNPFGVGTTVTSGIVSAIGAPRHPSDTGEDYIQTDAAINPGNSGGPLLNSAGQLIGINTAIISPSGGSSGIGFALPSNIARRVMNELRAQGHVNRGYLGIGLQPLSPALNDALNLDRPGGAIITDVAEASPAAQAGLRKGDVVMGINGRPVRDFDRLRLAIAEAQPGAPVQLAIEREGQEQMLTATLAERPAAPAASDQPDPAELPGAILTALPGELGVLITAVDPAGDTAEAGLRPGDIIVAINRQPVTGLASLGKGLAGRKSAVLEVIRQGGTLFFPAP